MDDVARNSPLPVAPGVSRAPATITTWLSHDDWKAQLRASTQEGLQQRPACIPPVWFYDEKGRELYQQIALQPEYYLARAEHDLLTSAAARIMEAFPARAMVDLGSGAATKARLILPKLHQGGLRQYVPFDVSERAVTLAADAVGNDFPDIAVQGIVGDFNQHMEAIPSGDGYLVSFLGSKLGNMDRTARRTFLTGLRERMGTEDAVLLGTDLMKDIRRLEQAYNDAAGVTAAFNTNCLSVMNAKLGATFRLKDFEHHARWVPDERRIEMRLEAIRPVHVQFEAWDDFSLRLSAGEWLHTESCHKFTFPGLLSELGDAGFTVVRQWTDPDTDYALTLATPAG